MNSKLLFAATVAISLVGSLAGTLAYADEAQPLTRAQVRAELDQAIATHTLQRTDYDATPNAVAVNSDRTRGAVVAELAAAKRAKKALVGPNGNASYNPNGTAILARSTLPRAEVKQDVRDAAANGTLQRTDYDDAALLARRAHQHAAAPAVVAQRVKALFTRSES